MFWGVIPYGAEETHKENPRKSRDNPCKVLLMCSFRRWLCSLPDKAQILNYHAVYYAPNLIMTWSFLERKENSMPPTLGLSKLGWQLAPGSRYDEQSMLLDSSIVIYVVATCLPLPTIFVSYLLVVWPLACASRIQGSWKVHAQALNCELGCPSSAFPQCLREPTCF